jgi:hypothetical protein
LTSWPVALAVEIAKLPEMSEAQLANDSCKTRENPCAAAAGGRPRLNLLVPHGGIA